MALCALMLAGILVSCVHGAFVPNFLYATVLNGTGYDKRAYPQQVNISTNLEIKFVNKVDTRRGELDLSLVTRMYWKDERLAYPAAKASVQQTRC